MTNDDKYARAVLIAACEIKRLRGAVRIQSAAIALLSAAAILAITARRKERKHDPP
jgi:hypothetical protein